MKKFIMTAAAAFVLTASLIVLLSDAHARSTRSPSRHQPNPVTENLPDRSILREMCGPGFVPPPAKGMQYDGERADWRVMLFRTGAYLLGERSEGVGFVLYENGQFYLRAPSSALMVYGTQGENYVSGMVVGGCSREQLSEALIRNNMLERARRVVPLDESLRPKPRRIMENEDFQQ